jgi:hypothetical protein
MILAALGGLLVGLALGATLYRRFGPYPVAGAEMRRRGYTTCVLCGGAGCYRESTGPPFAASPEGTP